MKISRLGLVSLASTCLWVAGATAIFAGTGAAPAPQHSAQSARLLAQGKYLVTAAAPCTDCHTPRDRHGRLIESRALQGAPIGVKPIHPVPGWKAAAPSIAGLPQGWSLKQTIHFLETGLTPAGGHAGPPMPPFRFNARDAKAVALYLQSLGKPKPEGKKTSAEAKL